MKRRVGMIYEVRMTLILSFTLMCITFSHASPPNWMVNPPDYQYNMPGIFRIVKANNIFMNELNSMVGIFVGTEIRGVVHGSDIIFIGEDAYFPATIFSNMQSGENLTFEVYVPSLDSIFSASETAIFNRNEVIGTPPNPFLLTIGMCDDILVLDADNSPLEGWYKAGQEIRVEGTVLLDLGMNLILDAPLVRSKEMFLIKEDATLTIEGIGCN